MYYKVLAALQSCFAGGDDTSAALPPVTLLFTCRHAQELAVLAPLLPYVSNSSALRVLVHYTGTAALQACTFAVPAPQLRAQPGVRKVSPPAANGGGTNNKTLAQDENCSTLMHLQPVDKVEGGNASRGNSGSGAVGESPGVSSDVAWHDGAAVPAAGALPTMVAGRGLEMFVWVLAFSLPWGLLVRP